MKTSLHERWSRSYRCDGRLLNIGLTARAIRIALCAAIFAACANAGAAQQVTAAARADVAQFRARVDRALAEAHAQRAAWGIVVADRDTGETLYAQNADHFFAPASNAKVFVTALALATLGPDYRFRTTLESAGTLGSDGHLSGDLILAGRGDPDLSDRKFPYVGNGAREGAIDRVLAEMADAAVAKGLREVDGDIIGDDSYFPYDPYPAGWTTGDLFFAFGAPVSAIAFNDNTITIEVQPGAQAGDAATMTCEPGAAADMVGLDVTTVAPGAASNIAVVRQAGVDFIQIRGTIPAGHAPMRLDLAMTDPAEVAARTLKALLEARGVHVTGSVRVQHAAPPESTPGGDPVFPTAGTTGQAPPNASWLVLAEHLSPPLLQSIQFTNKTSNNLHAELFLRTVAREKLGLGSTAAGLKLEAEFRRTAGIPEGDVVLSDGSGLARDDLVTPRAMVMLLRYAARQPWGNDFISTLPAAGVDGTLEDRMKNTAATGLIEAKTGTLEHDHALSGYATTLHGEYLAFSILCNNDAEHGPSASAPIDAIATAMIETIGIAYGGAQPAKKPK
ncbi:MAG TPA: D-alanyl-D-alanine carboxypeptidase/D-alanyl-D-alanine-endopeptidase [Candidatus Acidoferrales bacterium]|nr:D-alanyl-D-alanine carboxypeptidase/D-alanyl-D-alanine-endopeptidase [Candidatus Acidoferrales bacterium]